MRRAVGQSPPRRHHIPKWLVSSIDQLVEAERAPRQPADRRKRADARRNTFVAGTEVPRRLRTRQATRVVFARCGGLARGPTDERLLRLVENLAVVFAIDADERTRGIESAHHEIGHDEDHDRHQPEQGDAVLAPASDLCLRAHYRAGRRSTRISPLPSTSFTSPVPRSRVSPGRRLVRALSTLTVTRPLSPMRGASGALSGSGSPLTHTVDLPFSRLT